MNIDEIIAKALEEDFEERVEECSNNTEKHRFSFSYRLWEHKMLHDLRCDQVNTRRTVKKMRIAAASCIFAVLLLAVGIFAAVNMGRYSFDTKQEYSKLFIEKLSSDKTSFEEYYGLPEEDGWEIVEASEIDTHFFISYIQGEENVTFSQNIIMEGSMGNINTENAVVEMVSIYEENDGLFINFQKNGGCGLCWIYDGYFFEIFSNVTKDRIIELALSTKIVDFEKSLKKLVTNRESVLLNIIERENLSFPKERRCFK